MRSGMTSRSSGVERSGESLMAASGRDLVGVGREVLEQLGHGAVDVVGLDGAQAAGRGVGGGAAELGEPDPDAGELLDHLGARDEGDGLGRHDDQVAQAEHEGRSRDDGPGGGGDGRHLAAAAGEGGGGLAPAVEGGDAVGDVRAARGDVEDEGDAEVAGLVGGLGQPDAVGVGDGASCASSRGPGR